MIDEVICYIEEPPQLDCEIQTVKIEWQNEYFPYEGQLIWDAKTELKNNTTIETSGHYFTDVQNIQIIGHGLDKYTERQPEDVPGKEEQYIVVEPKAEEQILTTKNTYLDNSILVKASEFPPGPKPKGGWQWYLDSNVLTGSGGYSYTEDLIIKELPIEYATTIGESNAIYIGEFKPQTIKIQ